MHGSSSKRNPARSPQTPVPLVITRVPKHPCGQDIHGDVLENLRRAVQTLRQPTTLFSNMVRRTGNDFLERLLHRTRSPEHKASYPAWHARYSALTSNDRVAIHRAISKAAQRPKLSLLLPLREPLEGPPPASIDDVRRQSYPEWELCVAAGPLLPPALQSFLNHAVTVDPRIRLTPPDRTGNPLNSALALATGEFVLALASDSRMTEHALYLLADQIRRHPGADVLYSDEERSEGSGSVRPCFKPAWNPDLLLSHNYVGRLCAVRRSLAEAIGGFREEFEGSEDYDLILRVSSRTDRILHLPFVLHQGRSVRRASADVSARRAVEEHVGGAAMVENGPLPGTHRIRWPIAEPRPLVSLIVPSRDQRAILEGCVESILAKTAYRNFELLIVDNQSVDPDAVDYLASLEARRIARLLRFDAPFNFSAINNLAVRHARGSVIGLLNNDLEVIDGPWLEEMVSQALRADIGAVGARLLYPDDTVQHGGVILGISGAAGHAHKHAPARAPGYCGRAQLVQNVSAVTGACLLIRKETYQKVGGLDETFAVAYNDVDFCLRVRELGLRNLWTPFATLIHRESKSRGPEDGNRAKRARFQAERRRLIARWGDQLRNDPAYNPNLTLESEDFSLAWPPRVRKPWR